MQLADPDFPNTSLGNIVINADDFAQSEAIDQAIIDLATRKIIHSTSALVLSPRWMQSAKSLADLPIQVGLHLDLTSSFTRQSARQYSLSTLIFKAYTRRLDFKSLEKTIAIQYERFVEGYGKVPDFIDGHQHVHQLPIVRAALFKVLRLKGWGQQSGQWLRICNTSRWRGLKAWIIQQLGAKKTRKMATNAGIKTNADFAGVYDFGPATDLQPLWQEWLKPANSRFSVIMCHVAVPNFDLEDTIYPARVNEYQWLTSDAYKKLLGQLSSSDIKLGITITDKRS